MWYYDDGLDYSKPADREYIEKRKQEERERRIKEAKEERRSYLKGRHGVRYYYDPSKYVVDPYTPKLKCIFTRDLRREKLFAYLKYLNGKKVFVRDLAWKFAVTERTIQSDLKFLIDNGFIERQMNKTRHNRQTMNSYIVHKEKQKELAFGGGKYVRPIYVAKKDNDYYICVETDYGFYKRNGRRRNVEDCYYSLFEHGIDSEEYITKESHKLAVNYFTTDISGEYYGTICSIVDHGKIYDKDHNEEIRFRDKTFFTLMVLDELYPTTKDARWITLKVAPRRLKNKVNNKAIYNVKKLLGVKWPLMCRTFLKKI